MEQHHDLSATDAPAGDGAPIEHHKPIQPVCPKAGTADRICAEAGTLFAQHGFEAVSIRQIADACSLTIGAVYYYFPSKDGLLDEVTQLAFAEFHQNLVGRWQADPTRSISSLIGYMFDEAIEHPTFFLLMQRDLHHYDEGPRFSRSRHRYLKFSALIREALTARHNLETTDSDVDILTALISGFCELTHAELHSHVIDQATFIKARRAMLINHVQRVFQ